MSRSIPEWIGATPNTPVPPRVRLRVFYSFMGICQGQCGNRRIVAGKPWVCDHKIALINGGENRESNLQPICDWCDKNSKTPADIREKSKIADKRMAHLGIKRRSRPMPGSRASGIRKRMSGAVERW